MSTAIDQYGRYVRCDNTGEKFADNMHKLGIMIRVCEGYPDNHMKSIRFIQVLDLAFECQAHSECQAYSEEKTRYFTTSTVGMIENNFPFARGKEKTYSDIGCYLNMFRRFNDANRKLIFEMLENVMDVMVLLPKTLNVMIIEYVSIRDLLFSDDTDKNFCLDRFGILNNRTEETSHNIL